MGTDMDFLLNLFINFTARRQLRNILRHANLFSQATRTREHQLPHEPFDAITEEKLLSIH